MKWIAALALAAASLLAGCDQKAHSPAAGSQAAPGSQAASGSPAAPAVAAPATPPAPATGAPAAPAPPSGPEIPSVETIRRLTEVADQVCACKDRACAEAAYTALQEENKRLAGRPRATPTQADASAMQAQAMRLSGCLKQLP